MGKRYIIKDGKQIEVDGTALEGLLSKVSQEPLIAFGQVVRYKVQGAAAIGKITGMDKSGNILIAKAVNQTKAGFQFSSMDCDHVKKEDIVEKVMMA